MKRSSIVFTTSSLSSYGAISTVSMPMAQSKVQRLSVGSGCRSKTVPSSVSTAGWPSASNGIFRTTCRQTARLAKERSGLFFSRANASLCRIVLETLSFVLKCRRKEGTVSLGKQPPEECLPEEAFRSKPPSETEFRILCNALQSSPSLIHETLMEAIHAKESPRGGGGGRHPDLVCGGERRGR